MALINAELIEKLSSNPRFRAAEKSGHACVVPGATRASCATSSIPEVPVRPDPK
jgi:hypothetical protein